MKKALQIFFISIILILLGAVSVFAVDYSSYANDLQELGLFRGTGNGFELERAPTRAEAAVMLVRLNGAEKEAKAMRYTAPFTDLANWQKPYVQWLYSNKLTNGTSATKYSPDTLCTRQMYSAFMLRVLGYNEKNKDFSFKYAVSAAQAKGVLEFYEGDFTRGDMAAMSWWTIATPCKGKYATLLQDLVSSGAVPRRVAKDYIVEFRQRIDARNNIKNHMKDIIHAGGKTPQGDIGSNSLEALDYSYQKGERFIELDFEWTRDGQLVCLHDWNTRFFKDVSKSQLPLTLKQFQNSKIYGKYTPVTVKTLNQWLLVHPDAYIVTDIKFNDLQALSNISKYYPGIRAQMIVQCYQFNDYAKLSAAGYSNIIFTIYRLEPWQEKFDTQKLLSFVNTHRLTAFVFPKELADASYMSAVNKMNCISMVHTVNTQAEKKKYQNLGIDYFYRDY